MVVLDNFYRGHRMVEVMLENPGGFQENSLRSPMDVMRKIFEMENCWINPGAVFYFMEY